MDRKKLLSQAQKLHLDTSSKVLDDLVKESKIFEAKFNHLEKIDTTNVKPLVHPVETAIFLMREDESKKINNRQQIIENAPTSEKAFVTLKRELNHD